MFPGFPSRLLKEIQNMFKENELKNVKDKRIKIRINIIDSPRRKYSTVIGAIISANIYNTPRGEIEEEYWISKQDWDEVGPDIIFKKCQNYIL